MNMKRLENDGRLLSLCFVMNIIVRLNYCYSSYSINF